MPRQQLPKVRSVFNTMSRQTEIIVTIEFCNQLETRPSKCCDIKKNVVTFISIHLLNLCHDNENMCRDINFPFQIESKIDHVTIQRKYVATFFLVLF